MTVKLDVSRFSVVVWCTDCPDFRGLAFDVGEGHHIATAHENAAHPWSRTAENNAYKWRKRQEKIAA